MSLVGGLFPLADNDFAQAELPKLNLKSSF
jgi:hypothetical protein